MFSRKSKKNKEGVLAQGQATETLVTENTAPVETPTVSPQSILTQPQPSQSVAQQAAQPQIAGQEA